MPWPGIEPGPLSDRPALYHVTIKASLYRKAVQIYHIPITTTYSLSIFRFVRESQFEQPLNTRPTSLSCHRLSNGVFLHWAPDVTSEKNSNHQCHGQESNPGHLRDRPTLYHVAMKAVLYCKARQVYHIPTTTLAKECAQYWLTTWRTKPAL